METSYNFSTEEYSNISNFFWKNADWNYEKDFPELAKVQETFLLNKVIPLFSKESTIIELACSDGTYARKLAPFVKQIYAYELSEVTLQRARELNEKQAIRNINYAQADLIKTSLPRTPCDSVIAFGLFTCFINDDDMKKVVKDVSKLIPDGGYFILKDTLSLEKTYCYKTPDGSYSAKYRSASTYFEIFNELGYKMLDKSVAIRSDNVYSMWCILQK